MNDKLKKLIFSKLYKDLADTEVIECDGNVWFIDRKEKYWYLEYEKTGDLYWRYQFFTNFFKLFSMEIHEFQPIITDWVEDVLNCKVTTTVGIIRRTTGNLIDKVLNCN